VVGGFHRRGGRGDGHRRWINVGSELYSDVLDGEEPGVHVKGYDQEGRFVMGDGRVIKSPLLCYSGKVFVWRGVETVKDVTPEKLSLLRAVKPKPDILVLGSGSGSGAGLGSSAIRLSECVRRALYDQNISVEVVDTRIAISTFNILQQEGRRVVAALLPVSSPA